MNVGLISDTHGFLHHAVIDLFANVDHILHLGDIGEPEILTQLQQVAEVTAIRGNHEPDSLSDLPRSFSARLGGMRLGMYHGLNSMPEDRAPAMFPEFFAYLRKSHDLVLFGHTHEPYDREFAGMRFINPGYAGPDETRRRSVAILKWELQRKGSAEITVSFFDLDTQQPFKL